MSLRQKIMEKIKRIGIVSPLNFIFTSAFFQPSPSFVRHVNFSLSGTGLLRAVLFSMFCVTLDVEHIRVAFLKGEDLRN
jgi:hypothetical protein